MSKASKSFSEFVENGESSDTYWFKDLALRLLEKFTEDDEGFKFAFMDIFLRIKLIDPAIPLHGGNASLKFPVRKFFPNSIIDDMEVDIILDDLVYGAANIIFNFKYSDGNMNTKSAILKMTRKFVDGQWITKIEFDGGNKPMKFALSSDEDSMFNITYKHDENNIVKVDLVFKYFDQMSAILTVNDAIYSLNTNVDMTDNTSSFVIRTPNSYLDIDLFGKWYNRPIDVDVFQNVENIKLNLKSENQSILDLNMLIKYVLDGDLKSAQITMDAGNKNYMVDAKLDLLKKRFEINTMLDEVEFYIHFQLDETPEDKWVLQGTGH